MPLREVVAGDFAERETARGSRVILFAAVATLVWTALAAAVIYLLARHQPQALGLVGMAAISAGVAAPLCAIWLAALTIARVAPGQERATLARIEAAEARFAAISVRTRDELDALDDVLGTISGRVDTVRGAISSRSKELTASVAEMEERTSAISAALTRDRDAIEKLIATLSVTGADAHSEFKALIEALPAAERKASALAGALAAGGDTARAQVTEVEELLARLQSRNEAIRAAAEQQTARLAETLMRIEATGGSVAEMLGQRTNAIESSVAQALSRTEQALDATREGVEAQAAALAAGIDQARLVLSQLSENAGTAVAAQLAVLAGEAERLSQGLSDQEARSRALLDLAERGFGVLDAKLANASQTTGATLDRLNERLAAVREQIHELALPLGGTREATREIEVAVAHLREAIVETTGTADSLLPESATRAVVAVETARQGVSALMADVQQLNAAAGQIARPIETTLESFQAARQALADATTEIGAQLDEAKALAVEVESSAESSALAATTKLIEGLTRIREITAQAEGSVRAALDGVVAETRAALVTAGDEALRGIVAPVRAHLNEVEAAAQASAAAAQAAAERLSRQLVNVVETAAVVEARISEADSKLESASKDDLSRRANLLIEALNSASIDIAKALSNEVPDTAWAAYLRGDRGIFTRRAVRLLDGGQARAVAKRFQEDGEFREGVRRYIHDFEALIRRATAEKNAGPLGIALLSSDIGKLYVALAQAIERLR